MCAGWKEKNIFGESLKSEGYYLNKVYFHLSWTRCRGRKTKYKQPSSMDESQSWRSTQWKWFLWARTEGRVRSIKSLPCTLPTSVWFPSWLNCLKALLLSEGLFFNICGMNQMLSILRMGQGCESKNGNRGERKRTIWSVLKMKRI